MKRCNLTQQHNKRRLNATRPHKMIRLIPKHREKITVPPHETIRLIPKHREKITVPPHETIRLIPKHREKITVPPHETIRLIPKHREKSDTVPRDKTTRLIPKGREKSPSSESDVADGRAEERLTQSHLTEAIQYTNKGRRRPRTEQARRPISTRK